MIREAPFPPRSPLRMNYLAREARNKSLGDAGEQFVLRFEQARLVKAGQERLATKIEHVAQTKGDAEGYDILSYEESGRERLIEVKTTGLGVKTPFFVSRNEVATSREQLDRYHLYRVFDFRTSPRLFYLKGALDATCRLDPYQYSATAR